MAPRLKLLLLVTLVSLVPACVPFPVVELKTTAPEVRGRVIAAETHAVVRGAKISFDGRDDIFAESRDDGRFSLHSQSDLVLLKVATPCPMVDFPTPRRVPGAIVVRYPGSRDQRVLLGYYYFNMATHWKRGDRGENLDKWTLEVGDIEIPLSDSKAAAKTDVGQPAAPPFSPLSPEELDVAEAVFQHLLQSDPPTWPRGQHGCVCLAIRHNSAVVEPGPAFLRRFEASQHCFHAMSAHDTNYDINYDVDDIRRESPGVYRASGTYVRRPSPFAIKLEMPFEVRLVDGKWKARALAANVSGGAFAP
jgi:hypothetical protein